MRTGAVSGVATKYLARNDAKSVGIFGAGAQARTQLEAIKAVRDVNSTIVYDIAPERSKLFAEEMSQKFNISVQVAHSPDRLVELADIIVTASTSKTPVFKGDWLKSGTHINAIGSYKPDTRELDDSTIRRSKVVVDSMEAVLKEAGDLIIPLKSGITTQQHIYAELGQILIGMKAGRTDAREITVFKSTGLAIQDAATAELAYKKAQERNVGTRIDLA
jgi:ornithine cyclodeaminase/alanine dehydrogenase